MSNKYLKYIIIISLTLLIMSIMISSVSAYSYSHKVDGKTYTKSLGTDKIVIKNHTIYLKNKNVNKHGFNYNFDKIICYYKNGTVKIYNSNFKQWKISLNKNVVKVKIYYSGLNNTEKKYLEAKNIIPKKITITAKPSCGCNNEYVWHKKSFYNICPKCHRINCLLKNPKGVHEKELTCKYCDSDFCAVCGKEKYSWSHVYLIK